MSESKRHQRAMPPLMEDQLSGLIRRPMTSSSSLYRGANGNRTWTLTFSDANHGAISGPGGVRRTSPAGGVAEKSFSPSSSYMQFAYSRMTRQRRHNNRRGTFSQVRYLMRSANDHFNDNFSDPL